MQKTIWPYVTVCVLLGGYVPPAAAQAGVLLGLDTNQGYRTLWIATDGDSAALLASGPNLLVPRADGFWRAGVIALDQDTESAVVGPASRWDAVVDSVRQAKLPPSDDRCEPFDEVQILFLGPEYVSTRVWGGEETCGNVPNAWDHYFVTPLDATVPPVGEALGAGTSQQVEDALSMVRDSVRAALLADPAWTEDLVYQCYRSSGTWGIRRKPGGWEVAGSFPPLPRWNCDGVRVPLPVTLPSVVVDTNRMPVDLYEVSLVIPTVRDAVSSPRGDLIVALTGDSLYAARVEDGRIQRPALGLPVRGRIVMAEWSLGRHVQRWTREVRPLLGTDSVAAALAATPRPYGRSMVGRILSLRTTGERRETGNVVPVGQAVVVGFDRTSVDSTVIVDDVRIDGRDFEVMPDTAREGITLDVLLAPRFYPAGPGRHWVRARVGPKRGWGRVPTTHEFFAIDHAEGNDSAVIGQPPELRLTVPDGATGVPVDYLPQLDFSEPVRYVAGRVTMRRESGEEVPLRVAAVGTDAEGNDRVYPGIDAMDGDVAVRSVTLIPETPLRFGTRYLVVLYPGIVDTDTTLQGTPDPQALSDEPRQYVFETYQPHLLATSEVTAATHIATRNATAYLAVGQENGEDRLETVNLADPTRRFPGRSLVLEMGGRVEGLSPLVEAGRVAAGIQSQDGAARLVLINEGSVSLTVSAVVRLPEETRIADVAAAGRNVYVASQRGVIHVIGLEGAYRARDKPPAEGTVAGTIPAVAPTAHIADLAVGDFVLDGVPRTMLVTVGTSPLLTISDPGELETVAVVDSVRDLVQGSAVAVGTVAGRQLAVIVGPGSGPRGEIIVVDLTDPRHPVVLGSDVLRDRPRDVLLDGAVALVSGDSTTDIIGLGNLAFPRPVGRIDGLGGRLAWVRDGVAAGTSNHLGSGGLWLSALAPLADASLRPFNFALDDLGRPAQAVTIQYQVVDPPPTGEPYVVVLDGDRPVISTRLSDTSPGIHSLGLPPGATFRPRVRNASSGIEIALVLPDGSESRSFVMDQFPILQGPRPQPPSSAPSRWDRHEPRTLEPRLDSITPSHAPRGSSATLILHGTDLDSIRVNRWTRPDEFVHRPATTYPVVKGPEGATFTLPDSLAATPGALLVETTRFGGGRTPFLITEPALPPVGPGSVPGSPTIDVYRTDRGWEMEVQGAGNPEPGRRLVIGRGTTPGFALEAAESPVAEWNPRVDAVAGLIPDLDLGEADDLFVAVRSADGRSLSPPIPIPSRLADLQEEEEQQLEPAFPETPWYCGDYYQDADYGRNGAWLSEIFIDGPRALRVTGFGLDDGMRIVLRRRTLDGELVDEASVPLTSIEAIGPDPEGCSLEGPVRLRQQARFAFTIEAQRVPFARLVWLTDSGASGRRP